MRSASTPIRAPKPFPDRLVRGVVLVALSLFHLQLKLLGGLVRLGIALVKREVKKEVKRGARPPARPRIDPAR